MKTKILFFSVIVLSLVFYFSVAIADMTWIPFNSGTEPQSPAVEALTSDINGIIIKFNMAGMFRTDKEIEGELYQLLNIPSGGHTAEIGSPEVPTVGRYIAVPYGASVSIEVISTKSKILDGYNVFPAQEPLPDDVGFDESTVQFQKNLQAYSMDAFYPISIAEVEQPKIIRGLGVSLVGIFPVRFNPVSSQIEVYSEIEVRVSFNGGYGYFVDDKYRSPYFEPLYRNLLLNFNVLGAFPEQTHTVDYLVITHDNYYSNILPLADWKHRKGLSTRILRVPTDVAASTSAIKDSIQSYYDNYGTSFVLFVGDASDIPTWYVTTHPYHGSKTATDIYYATVAGTDYFPDIFLGRLPINTASINVVVNKILNYERNPYMGTTAWYNTPLVAGYFQDSYSPYGYADRFFLQTSETIRSFLGSMGYDSTNYVYSTNCTAAKPWYYYYGSPIPPWLVFTNPGTNEVINAINSGCFLVQHRDHGAISGWGDPAFYSSNIASLNNGEMLPVVYSVNCQTGWFDYSSDSFCETFLKKQNGGCVGIVGATRVSYSGHNDELSKGFYDAIWPNFDPTYPTASSTNPLLSSPYCNLGIILNFAKFWMYDKYVLTGGAGYPWSPSAIIDLTEFEMFHVFGCPEMELWTDVPAPLTVSHPTNIPVGISSSVTVTVQSSGSPVLNALVCLLKDGDIYDRAFTPSSGQVTFTVNPSTPGNIYVTVTKHNFQPYEGTITCTGGSIGTLAGTVTNATTGSPILAMITIKETGQQTTTNPATGYYSMSLVPGTYTAKASANGFAPDSTIVTILQNQTTVQDFALAPVGITVLPDSFNIVLKQGTNGTRVMTIRNDGSGLLAYQILWNFSEEIGTGAKTPFAPIMSIKLKIPEKMDPVAGYASKMNNLLEQAANDICPSPIRDIQAPEAIWDLLFDYDVQTPTGDNQCLGVEFDGTHFWITGGGGTSGTVTNKLHKFDRDGNYIQSFDQGTVSDWGWRDLAWDGTYLYASDEYELAIIDPGTGSKIGTIPGPLSPNRALAYDPATDHFWTADFFSDIYEFDRNGNYWIYPNTPVYAIYGMAWDDVSAGGPWLWIWSQDGTPAQLCSQYDPINHQFTGVTYLGKGTNVAGGACFIPDWQTDTSFAVFVGLDQTEPDHIMGYEMGAGILTNWWLAVDPPLSGTIAAGRFAQNTVQFRTTYEGNTLPVGDYYATITVVNNNPITPTVNIPVHLIVEAVDPDINVNPLSFDVTLPSGGATTETLNIGNTGSGTLGFAIYEGQAGDEAGFIRTKADDPVVIGVNSHRSYDFVTATNSVQDDNLPVDFRRPGPIPIDIGQIVHQIPAPGGLSNGLTWDGTNLWSTDFNNVSICKLNPETGTIITQFPAPGAINPSDLAWDGSSLWHHDFGIGIVYQLNPSTGAVISSFTEPTIDISEGLTWDGQYLWIGGYNSIYQVTTSGVIINSIPAPGVPGTGIDGLTWDGTYLWVIGYDLIIYQVDPGDGTVIKYFATPSASPNGLAFDGAFLWDDDGVQGVINQIDIEFMFNIPWLSEDPTSGLVPSGSDANKPITVSFDATSVGVGDHYAKLYIISNDPDEPLVTVPVHLEVGGDILIWSPPGVTATSSSAIQNALTANGKTSIITSDLTAYNLANYSYVFVCLGIYSNNHVLGEPEATQLVNYLNGGGRLYMEGGDTWSYDPPTVLHPMFKITGVSDGSNDMNTVLGDACLAGYDYTYSGENNYMDRLAPQDTAVAIHNNSSPAYTCGIFWDYLGGSYRTIGTSFQFGGLDDASASGYTKADLIAKYLEFFDNGCPSTPPTPTNLYAFNGYNDCVPLAWDAPAGFQPLEDSKESEIPNPSDEKQEPRIRENRPEPPPPELTLQSYKVFRSSSSGGPYSQIAAGVTRQYYRDETVTGGNTYYYVVKAVYDVGESDYSNEDDGIPVNGGYYINSGWAAAAPVLDGFINPAEWASADVVDITYPGVTPPVTLYVMNNGGHLYVAVDDPGNLSLEDYDQIGIYFDEDYNREWPPGSPSGEGNFWIEWLSGIAQTEYRGMFGWWPGNMGFDTQIPASGVNQAISTASGHVQYEVDFDLTASELNAAPGDVIGYQMYALIEPSYIFSGHWPQEILFCPWSDAWRLPAVYGDLELAAEGVHVVIPDTIGQRNTMITIPIKVTTDVTGMGIFAAEIELIWNAAILDNASAARGPMVPSGWLFHYTSTPGSGKMTIWMAGTESIPPTDPLAGVGSLVMLTFEVVGLNGQTSPIHFDKMVFNEGTPLAIPHDGSVYVLDCYDITGHIYYCLNGDPVDDAIVPVLGTPYRDTTDVNGDYELLCLSSGDYVVKPEKENDLGSPPAISAYDAAWILQYGVGIRPFVPCQMIAADVTGNGSVTAYDAAMILQWGVGIILKFPVMPDYTHFWRFVPDDFVLTMSNWMVAPNSISYTPLNSNVVDNYKAIIYGDVSGNWQSTEGGLAKATLATVDIRLENVYGKAGDKVSLPINVDNASDIIAMNFTLEYDPQVLKAVGASLTSLTQDYLIAHDIKDGLFKVALAGSQPIVGSGAIVNLEFEVLDTESPDAGCALEITEMVINDGSIAANIQVARFESGAPVPDEYVLHQNYPNPFNPETSIKYQLPKSGKVVLKIYNSLGQEIRTLVNEEKEAGYHEARWDGTDNNGVSVSSGIYIYRIQAGDFISSKKMIFMM